MILGNQFVFDYQECDAVKINDAAYLHDHLEKILNQNGCTIIASKSHSFTPQGITLFFILAESHVALHTWPEHNAACLDVFLCTSKEKGLKIGEAFSLIIDAKHSISSHIQRGELLEKKECA